MATRKDPNTLPVDLAKFQTVKFARFEQAVRPFQTVVDKLPDPPAPVTLLPGEGSEAFASWGGPSSLTVIPPVQPIEDLNADTFTQNALPGVNIQVAHGDKVPPRGQSPQDKKQTTTTLQEIDRQTETITVYKPGDNTVWVNVQRIKVIRFRQIGGPTIALPQQKSTRGGKLSTFFPERNPDTNPPRSEPIGAGQIIVMKMKPPPPPPRPKDD